MLTSSTQRSVWSAWRFSRMESKFAKFLPVGISSTTSAWWNGFLDHSSKKRRSAPCATLISPYLSLKKPSRRSRTPKMAASSQVSSLEALLRSKNPVHSRINKEVSNNCKHQLLMAHPPELIAFMSGTMIVWIQVEHKSRVMDKDCRLRASATRMVETVAVSHRLR